MLKILIVEDTTITRLILKKMLDRAGYDVVGEASDVTDAVNKYESLLPDLTLMDIGIPGKSEFLKKEVIKTGGIEVIKEILKKNPDAKIIACTAMSYKEVVMEVLQIGVKDYLLKPIEPDRLLASIKKVFG